MGCLLYPAGYAPMEGTMAVPDQTTEDLQLERMAAAMSHSAYYRLSAADLNVLWTEDPAVLQHRQAVLADLLALPALEGAMDRLLGSIDGWETRSGGVRRGLDGSAVGLNLEDFSWLGSCLKKLASASAEFSAIPVQSAGLKALTETLAALRGSDRFRAVEADFQTLCAGHVSPAKMRLGFNLDQELKPGKLKLLNMEPWTGDLAESKGRKPAAPEKRRLMLTQRAVETNAMLLQRTVMSASQAVSAFVIRETAALRGLKKDLIFCLSALKLCRSWSEAGLRHCFPTLLPKEDRAFRAKDMFDPLLLLGEREAVISNDIALHDGGELAILTGANQGGKTVFLLSMALTQWLAQLGLPVPAAEAALSPADRLLTVFAPNGQRYGRRGLLAEEAERIAAAVAAVTPHSMVFFNEPLTSTGPEEAKSISAEVIAVFKAAGVRGVWVTHVYDLAARRALLEEAVPWGSRLGSLRILVEEGAEISRFTYKVARGEPDFNSRAGDVLRRKGVTLTK